MKKNCTTVESPTYKFVELRSTHSRKMQFVWGNQNGRNSFCFEHKIPNPKLGSCIYLPNRFCMQDKLLKKNNYVIKSKVEVEVVPILFP